MKNKKCGFKFASLAFLKCSVVSRCAPTTVTQRSSILFHSQPWLVHLNQVSSDNMRVVLSRADNNDPYTIHQIFLVTWSNIPQLNLGSIRGSSPILETVCCEKKWRIINNSLHLAWNYTRILILGHYLFLEAHKESRLTLWLSTHCTILQRQSLTINRIVALNCIA